MSELTNAVVDFREKREPAREIIAGWMINYEGRSDGTARVADKPGFVYVLVDRGEGHGSGDIIRAFCRLRPVPGWAVRVSTTRDRPWEYSVLEIDRDAMGGSVDGVPVLEPHAETHIWGGEPSGGTDIVYPRFLQLYDFGVWPGTGTNVVVQDGVFNPSGSKLELPYTDVDLSEWWPSGTLQRWIVVCLSPTGTIELWPGPASSVFLDVEDIPEVPCDYNWWELAAVRMEGWESDITMVDGDENIIDLRFSEIGWPCQCCEGGTGSGVTTFLALDDTEDSYVGRAGYYPRVNAIENALEWGASLYADFAGNLVWTEGNIKTDGVNEYTPDAGVTVESVKLENGEVVLGEAGAAQVYDEMLTVYRNAAIGAYQTWNDGSVDLTLGVRSEGPWGFVLDNTYFPLQIDRTNAYVLVDPGDILSGVMSETFAVALGDTAGADELAVYDSAGYKVLGLASDTAIGLYDNAAENLIGEIRAAGATDVVLDIDVYPVGGTNIAEIRFFRLTNTSGAKTVKFLKGDNTATVHSQIGVDDTDTYFTNTSVGIGINAPLAALDVRGKTLLQGWVHINDTGFVNAGTGDSRPTMIFGATDDEEAWYFGVHTSTGRASAKMGLYSWEADSWTQVWLPNGSVGIGTETPAGGPLYGTPKLHIHSGSETTLKLEGAIATWNAAAIELKTSDNKSWGITHRGSTGTVNELLFMYYNGASSITALTISPTGKIGIGKTPDSAIELDVSGDIRASGSCSGWIPFTLGSNSPFSITASVGLYYCTIRRNMTVRNTTMALRLTSPNTATDYFRIEFYDYDGNEYTNMELSTQGNTSGVWTVEESTTDQSLLASERFIYCRAIKVGSGSPSLDVVGPMVFVS